MAQRPSKISASIMRSTVRPSGLCCARMSTMGVTSSHGCCWRSGGQRCKGARGGGAGGGVKPPVYALKPLSRCETELGEGLRKHPASWVRVKKSTLPVISAFLNGGPTLYMYWYSSTFVRLKVAARARAIRVLDCAAKFHSRIPYPCRPRANAEERRGNRMGQQHRGVVASRKTTLYSKRRTTLSTRSQESP